jgi:hypothetical protein
MPQPFTERVITVTRREYAVPVDPTYGALHAAVGKAWRAAERAYRETAGMPENGALADNAIAFWPGETEIVISYETDRPATVTVEDAARVLAAHDRLLGRQTAPYAQLPAAEQQQYLASARSVLAALTTDPAPAPVDAQP